MPKLTLVAALSSSLLVSACCTPGVIGSVAVPLRAQQTSMWCWAASGQMTMNFVRPASAVGQPDQANKQFGRTDCGNSPTPSACVNGGWPEYAKYGFTANRTSDTALTFAQIKKQIGCSKKPFAFSWHWNGGGGHMMVVTGYVTINGVQHVAINNPWAPNVGEETVITYADYVGGAGFDHTHWDDFYNISYTGK